jgi:hypothetical protein
MFDSVECLMSNDTAGTTPSMRRPVRVKTVLFFLSVDPYFLAEPHLSLIALVLAVLTPRAAKAGA